MLFNSVVFLAFFASVLVLYRLLPGIRTQNLMLLTASYVFYAAWDWRFLSLIWISTVVDFVVARRIASSVAPARKRAWLALSLGVNLGMLGFFKYWNFGIDSLAELLMRIGLTPHLPTLEVILPVGISFYTFQTISYTVDVFRGHREPTTDPLAFGLYVAYFPQLVAGPIERSTRLLPQIARARTVAWEDYRVGFWWMLLGYFKKVVIADSLAPMVNHAFAAPDRVTGAVSLVAALGYVVQLYGDFAGYSLIARGASRCFGIHLMQNFRAPFLARDPRDIWSRWHVSLSTWLRDYLYLGLGGNRNGRLRTYRNVFLTMLLGGLWHGAGWNFVLWGAYWGVIGVLWYDRGRAGPADRSPLTVAASIVGTFVLWAIGTTIFRCHGLAGVSDVFGNIATNFAWTSQALRLLIPVLTCLALLQTYHLWQEKADDELVLLRAPAWARIAVATALLATILAVGFRPIPFVYFQF